LFFDLLFLHLLIKFKLTGIAEILVVRNITPELVVVLHHSVPGQMTRLKSLTWLLPWLHYTANRCKLTKKKIIYRSLFASQYFKKD